MDDFFDDLLLNTIKNDMLLDQGYIEVDDTGNIEAVMNNLEFADNPLYSQLSFISVWVYKRHADVRARCCAGSGCSSVESNACIQGVGFSHDLAFAGKNYLNLHPPQLFNKFTSGYYMPVYVSDSTGRASDYLGEYQHFSSPVNAVGDREFFDVYLGVYYNVFNTDNAFRPLRVINAETDVGDRTIYTAVNPDWLSPVIPIETRFYPRSKQDPPGSFYHIPHMVSWTRLGGDSDGLFYRNSLRINELGSAVNAVTENDYIEIYNPSPVPVPMESVYLYRWTDASCDSLPGSHTRMNLSNYTIPAGGYFTLARSGHSLSNIDETLNASIGLINEGDCFALVLDGDSVFSVTDRDIIDFVGTSGTGNNYEGSGPARVVTNFSPVDQSISRCADGVDTDDNGVDFKLLPPTPGQTNRCDVVPIGDLNAGQLLLSEVNYDPDTGSGFEGGAGACDESDDEFYEVFNPGTSTINLAGGSIQYGTSGGNFNGDVYFGNQLIGPGEYVVVVSQDAGCYTSATLSGRKAIFRGTAWSLSGAGATFALVRDDTDLPDGQTGSAIDQGSTVVLDYMGSAAGAVVYEGTGRATDCNDQSSIRTIPTLDTNDNAADWSCTNANGTPGR
ncbi:MAG: lamin tail domain-containing protein [Leptospiraceae bacterium]|nr:lamin tail domain-containing protein [Leptospiraceae bacterium]